MNDLVCPLDDTLAAPAPCTGTAEAAHPPFERQPGESTRSFALFQLYLGLGPLHRSYKAAALEAGITSGRLAQHAVRHNWRQRAEAYDDAQWLLRQQERAARELQHARPPAASGQAGNFEEAHDVAESVGGLLPADADLDSLPVPDVLRLLAVGARGELHALQGAVADPPGKRGAGPAASRRPQHDSGIIRTREDFADLDLAPAAELKRQPKRVSARRRLCAVWRSIVRRTYDPRYPAYRRYGGRGIYCEPAWLDSDTGLAAFIRDVGPPPSPRHRLLRRDTKLPWTAANSFWGSPEQFRNRMHRRFLETVGFRLPLSEWARLRGLPASSILYRLRKGMTPEEAVAKPKFKRAEYTCERRSRGKRAQVV
jgi:hypothetical protein